MRHGPKSNKTSTTFTLAQVVALVPLRTEKSVCLNRIGDEFRIIGEIINDSDVTECGSYESDFERVVIFI